MCSTLKGTYKAEQRTATIKQPTALQWAAMGGNARHYEPRSSTELQGTEKQGTMNRYH